MCRETHHCLRSGVKAQPPPPQTIDNTQETGRKLVDTFGTAFHPDPRNGALDMKADGGGSEAHLVRETYGAGRVTITRVGRTPCGAQGLPG